jgi:tRNA (guanine37-N1)-methyltransferase
LRIDIVTIFPAMFTGPFAEGVVARGVAAGRLALEVHDLRSFTTDRHRVVDDVPFGGGPGMVLKPEPITRAVEHIASVAGPPGAVVLTSPQGRRFTAADAERLAGLERLVVLCGRYEGVDDRIREHVATEELSIGDYVLSGGELAAMVIVDAVARFVPGVVGDERSVREDSFAAGRLDYPHYTRPAEFQGWRVPDVLLSGHHAEIERWRRRAAFTRTLERRPDLVDPDALDETERGWYRQWLAERGEGAEDERD